MGHDEQDREILCGKAVVGHPLHVEINGSRALDMKLCSDHKKEWFAHNASWFNRATTAKVALLALFEDHVGNLFTSAEIRDYLRRVLAERDQLLRGEEKNVVAAIQDRGKLSFEVQDLFRAVRQREEALQDGDWEEVTPAGMRKYLNDAFDSRDERLSPADMRLIAGMPERGMLSQPLLDLYARLRREDYGQMTGEKESSARS